MLVIRLIYCQEQEHHSDQAQPVVHLIILINLRYICVNNSELPKRLFSIFHLQLIEITSWSKQFLVVFIKTPDKTKSLFPLFTASKVHLMISVIDQVTGNNEAARNLKFFTCVQRMHRS